MRKIKLGEKSKTENPLEDEFFSEYEGFDEFDEHCCCEDEDKCGISDALIGGLIMTGVFVAAVAFLSMLTYLSVLLFKKTAKLIKN